MDIKLLSIDQIGLSRRSTNALHRIEVHTVGKMLEYSEEQLSNVRNIGAKSIAEILAKIEEYSKPMQVSAFPDVTGSPSVASCALENFDTWLTTPNAQDSIAAYLKETELKVDVLELLPAPAYNLLLLNGYEFLHQIAFLSEDALLQIPRMNLSVATEITRSFLYYVQENRDDILKWVNERQNAQPKKKDVTLYDMMQMPEYREAFLQYATANDCEIQQMGLSARPRNQLLKSGYRRRSELIFLSREELLQLPSMGAASVEEIIEKITTYLTENESRLLAMCHGDTSALWDDTAIRDKILAAYTDIGFDGLSLNELVELVGLPEEIPLERLKKLIGGLIAAGELEYVDYRCYRIYGKFVDYLETCSSLSERSRDMIRKRLQGNTLERIAQEYDLTRERVRQILKRDVKKVQDNYMEATGMKWFDEDYYRHFYETYSVEKGDGTRWLGISTCIYNYLDMMDVKSGKTDIHTALEDHTLDAGLRLKIKSYLNRSKIYLDDRWIEKKRADLEEYVVQKFCKEDTSFDQFIQIYNNFLSEEEIPYDEDIYYTPAVIATRKNRLTDALFLLWKQNEMIRYYDIGGYDFTELLDVLNLGAYENIELSTTKFIEDYPEIMEKYDIRNQYELHNLLRKIVPEGSYHDFCCCRMPNIRFGIFDRDEALLDLLINSAPISTADFTQLIHQEYGYDQATIMGTYLQSFSEYYHQGVYSIDQKQMPYQNRLELQAALTEDFYYIDEIRKIYASLFPKADVEEINPYNLKSMGFIVLSRYAVQHYNSLDSYFRHILMAEDIVDITPYRRRFVGIQAFSQTLKELKQTFAIIEFEPNQIITFDKLERSGVSKEMLQDFCDQVYDYVEDDTYFNAQSLRLMGFESELYDLGFSDWFYSNLLATDERFSFARIFSTVILYKGTAKVSIQSFELALVTDHGSVDSYDLMAELTDIYGCKPGDKYDVLYKLNGTKVYYDRILDRLYANAELYYRELDDTEGM